MREEISVLFRCDGDEEIGLGHVVRCLALAEELTFDHNCRVTFAINRGKTGIDMIKEYGYALFTINNNMESFSEGAFLKKAVQKTACDVLIMDFREKISLEFLVSLKKQGILLVDIDDPDEKRLVADLAFYPPVPQVKKMDWSGFKGQLMVGWEWVILRKEFINEAKKQRHPNDRLHILVTMGGSDPAGFTLKAMEALELLEEEFDTTVVLGRAFSGEKELHDFLIRAKREFKILKNVENMAKIMASADLAIASFGVTAYELAYMGVPAVYICLTDDHAESCQAFVEAGVAVKMGGENTYCLDKILQLVRNEDKRVAMMFNTENGLKNNGTKLMAAKIIHSLRSFHHNYARKAEF